MTGLGGRERSYSTGDKVYGSGRPHPTSGPVDPAGYMDRKNNKNASNRRSGLAAAAGRRLQGTNPTAAMQFSGGPPVAGPATISAQPNSVAPIVLSDGRKIMTTPTGQYVFLPEGLENGLD